MSISHIPKTSGGVPALSTVLQNRAAKSWSFGHWCAWMVCSALNAVGSKWAAGKLRDLHFLYKPVPTPDPAAAVASVKKAEETLKTQLPADQEVASDVYKLFTGTVLEVVPNPPIPKQENAKAQIQEEPVQKPRRVPNRAPKTFVFSNDHILKSWTRPERRLVIWKPSEAPPLLTPSSLRKRIQEFVAAPAQEAEEAPIVLQPPKKPAPSPFPGPAMMVFNKRTAEDRAAEMEKLKALDKSLSAKKYLL